MYRGPHKQSYKIKTTGKQHKINASPPAAHRRSTHRDRRQDRRGEREWETEGIGEEIEEGEKENTTLFED